VNKSSQTFIVAIFEGTEQMYPEAYLQAIQCVTRALTYEYELYLSTHRNFLFSL